MLSAVGATCKTHPVFKKIISNSWSDNIIQTILIKLAFHKHSKNIQLWDFLIHFSVRKKTI